MPLVSIIAPVFNVQQYLDEFIQSILKQTFMDFELLLIDDGSNDNSLGICKGYFEDDNRVKVFHQENKGVSNARNLGIKNASGKWISFIDPDDYVESDFLEKILSCLNINKDIDLVECYIKKFDDNGKNYKYKKFYKKNVVLSGKQWLFNAEYYFTKNKNLPRTVLYSADIIRKNNLLFNENYSVCEDCDFVFRYAAYIHNVFIDTDELYCYRQRIKSATRIKGISVAQFSAILFFRNYVKSSDNMKLISSFILGEAKIYMRLIVQEFLLKRKTVNYGNELSNRLDSVKSLFFLIFSKGEWDNFKKSPVLFMKKELRMCNKELKLDFSSFKYKIISFFISNMLIF